MVTKLFTEIAPLYADRNGGYTRVFEDRSAPTAPRWLSL